MDYHLTVKGMKKINFLILLLISILALGGCSKKNQNKLSESNLLEINQPQAAINLPAQTVSGITAQVQEVTKQGGKTFVKVSMDNHQYDLAGFDIFSQTNLAGAPLAVFRVIESGSGGHHLKAELMFNGELSGKLILALGKDYIFDFNL